MFLRRLVPAIPLLFAVCSAGAQQSSISNGSTSAAKINPYIQQRSPAYTSFDNPYAPGAAYDPYRGSRPTTASTAGGSSGLRPRSRRHSDDDDTTTDSSASCGSGSATGMLGTASSGTKSYSQLSGMGGCTGSGTVHIGSKGGILGKKGLASGNSSTPGQAETIQNGQMQQLQKLPQ